jgi:hypothetical protein
MDAVSAQQQKTRIATWPRLRSSLSRGPDITCQPSHRFRLQRVCDRHRLGKIAFGAFKGPQLRSVRQRRNSRQHHPGLASLTAWVLDRTQRDVRWWCFAHIPSVRSANLTAPIVRTIPRAPLFNRMAPNAPCACSEAVRFLKSSVRLCTVRVCPVPGARTNNLIVPLLCPVVAYPYDIIRYLA